MADESGAEYVAISVSERLAMAAIEAEERKRQKRREYRLKNAEKIKQYSDKYHAEHRIKRDHELKKTRTLAPGGACAICGKPCPRDSLGYLYIDGPTKRTFCSREHDDEFALNGYGKGGAA